MNSEPQPAHSSFIGGSNAAARIACPASYQMEKKLPVAAKEESSDYADEGSACHAAMAAILDSGVEPQDLLGNVYPGYEDYPITQELIDEALVPCINYFDVLDEEIGPIEYRVECRVEVTSIPGVFGTADVIGKGPNCSVVVDWKFGAGVQVLAWYTDERDEVVPNEQPMLYTLAATLTHPEMFDMANPNWPIEIVIAQPRYREGPNFDRIRVTLQDIWDFEYKLLEAAHEAKRISPPPRMRKGSWCRFMACKTICPLHTGPLLDASALGSLLAKSQLQAAVDGGAGDVATVDWDKTYGLMLDLASQIEPVIRDWRAQAQAYLEEGNPISGYKLVDKRASRKWTKSDQSVERKLARLGLSKDERMPRSLVSPPQAEKLLKKYEQALPKGYFDALSSGLTLAPDSDKRQAKQPVGDVVKSLTSALAAITRQDPEA